jgi:hypothetical protein
VRFLCPQFRHKGAEAHRRKAEKDAESDEASRVCHSVSLTLTPAALIRSHLLSKGSPLFLRIFLLAGMLFIGAGLLCCVTVPKAPETAGVVVLFEFTGRHDSVCLSGDFNDWSPESHCLQPKGDTWSVQLVLSPGRYRYGFILDKRDWVCDPDALIQEDDGFGKKNSVLVIESDVTKSLSGT